MKGLGKALARDTKTCSLQNSGKVQGCCLVVRASCFIELGSLIRMRRALIS